MTIRSIAFKLATLGTVAAALFIASPTQAKAQVSFGIRVGGPVVAPYGYAQPYYAQPYYAAPAYSYGYYGQPHYVRPYGYGYRYDERDYRDYREHAFHGDRDRDRDRDFHEEREHHEREYGR